MPKKCSIGDNYLDDASVCNVSHHQYEDDVTGLCIILEKSIETFSLHYIFPGKVDHHRSNRNRNNTLAILSPLHAKTVSTIQSLRTIFVSMNVCRRIFSFTRK